MEDDKGLRAKADRLLAQIRDISGGIGMLEGEFNDAVEKLKVKYSAEVKGLKEILAEYEKQLIGLMKTGRRDLFDGTDIVRLANGVLLHESKEKVSLSRETLELCKQHGFTEAVKIAESLDRAVLEQWPDPKLLLVNAARKRVESFNYEIKR